MREWIIECSRPITQEDRQKGRFGARICKSFIVQGDTEEDARANVQGLDGFSIDSVEDWERIKQENREAAFRWLWRDA